MSQEPGVAEDRSLRAGVSKAATGIPGFDEITGGGLPHGRPTLVCGGPGCGKTLFAMEFLVRGAVQFDEPGVFLSFEESASDLIANVASLGFDLPELIAHRRLYVDVVQAERSEIEETGDYDLEGLFIRLGHAIEAVHARRVVLDTIEALFAALPNEGILRAELCRLFRWLKQRGMTAVVTGESGAAPLFTRRGLEEYVSDCVILLDQSVREQISTRRLRIVKYRGSAHGTNEYPFLIHDHGISVLPVTSLGLDHQVSTERISLGIPRLDSMLGGTGVYRGTSVLVSGSAGTGKTSIAAHAIDAACRRGERCLYFAFEEAPRQILRNMRSIGIDLAPWQKAGRLQFHAARPTLFGLETHLATMHQQMEEFGPALVVVDPITNLISVGASVEVQRMLTRLIDFLKSRQTTAIFVCLTHSEGWLDETAFGVSSLMDTWLLLQFVDGNGERNRCLSIVKSRGMAYSNQVREFVITDHGVDLVNVYVGTRGVLTGTARHLQMVKEQADALARRQEVGRRKRALERKRQDLERRIGMMRAEFEEQEEDLRADLGAAQQREQDQKEASGLRRADLQVEGTPNGGDEGSR